MATAVRGGANEHKILADNKYDQTVLGGNSQCLKSGTLLKVAGNAVEQAAPGDTVYGVCKSLIETTADNKTVARREVLLRRLVKGDTYVFSIALNPTTGAPTGAVLTEADVLKYYNFDAEHFVDSASGAVAPGALPLRLLKIFDGGIQGEFEFVV